MTAPTVSRRESAGTPPGLRTESAGTPPGLRTESAGTPAGVTPESRVSHAGVTRDNTVTPDPNAPKGPGTWWPATYGPRMHYAREDAAGLAECGRPVERSQRVTHHDPTGMYCGTCWRRAFDRYGVTWPLPEHPHVI